MFADLGGSDLDGLAAISSWRQYPKGQLVVREGDLLDCYYIVAAGVVRVFKHSRRGRDFTLVVLHSGEPFGASALFAESASPWSVVTVTPTALLALHREGLTSLLLQRHAVSVRISTVLARGFNRATDMIVELVSNEADVRVLKVLVTLCNEFGSFIPFSHQQVAEMSGTCRETASKVLAKLSDSNIARSLHGTIAIVDKDRLRLAAED